MSFRVINTDVIAGLRQLPADSVHMVCTSPPYWALRDYGVDGQLGLESTAEEYLANMVEVFREVRRVMHSSGSVWLNMGDSYCSDAGTIRQPTTLEGPRVPTGWTNRAQPMRVHAIRKKQDIDPLRIPAASQTLYKAVRPQGYLKPKDLAMMPARLAIALQQDGWYLRSQIPWIKTNCLSGGTWLYARTQKGEMPVMLKDLVRLRPETVQLWNGQRWTQVVSWTDSGRPADAIEIELRTGERIGCTRQHRWPTQRGLIHAEDIRIGDVIDSTTNPEPDDCSKPAWLPDEDIGWLVGLYLAEGCRDGNDALAIAGHRNETIDRMARLSRIAAALDATACSWESKTTNQATIRLSGRAISGVIDTYIGGKDSHDKHLKVRCWSRTNEFLNAVLSGYLHGDGGLEDRRWKLGFTNNDALARDLRTICSRLGYTCRLRRGSVSAVKGGKKYKVWRGEIRTLRVCNDYPTTFKSKPDTEVVTIRQSRARRFWDVEVSDDPHLFALASGVLTHNSMPESTTDRPVGSIEYIYLLTKSETYFYDREAVRMAASGTANPKAMGPNSRMRRDQDPGHQTVAKITAKQNRSFSAAVTGRTATRARRSSDWFFASLETRTPEFSGLLVDGAGDPLAMLVNPQPFSIEMCEVCETIYSQTDYHKLPRVCSWPRAKGARGVDGGRPLCGCGSTSWLSHFATFPTRLVEPCLLAGTSEYGVCEHCGAPWERVTESDTDVEDLTAAKILTSNVVATNSSTKWEPEGARRHRAGDNPHSISKVNGAHDRGGRPAPTTIAWRATCSHPLFPCGVVPATVLDPFSGSGRTGLAATRHKRDYIGIELNSKYVAMSRWQYEQQAKGCAHSAQSVVA